MEKKEMKGGVFNECLLMNNFERVSARTVGKAGGGRGVSQMLTAAKRARGVKITKNVPTSLMDGPI